MVPVHILAGIVALVSGAVALAAAKGARLHRRSGRLFVYAMVTMALLGAAIAMIRGAAPSINVPAGLTTTYLVVTALMTVRPRSSWSTVLDRAAMMFGFMVGAASIIFGIVTLATASGAAKGMAYPLFLFGMVGLGGGLSDLKVMRNGGLAGAARLRRHLWRMCAALFIATGSFFLGQAQVFPAPVRASGLLAVPVFAVLAVMLYWLWRVRAKSACRVPASALAGPLLGNGSTGGNGETTEQRSSGDETEKTSQVVSGEAEPIVPRRILARTPAGRRARQPSGVCG